MTQIIKIPGRIESAATGNVVTGANSILDDGKGKKQNVINSEVDAELVRLDQNKQNNLTFDNSPTEDSNNPVKSGGVYAADKALSDAIEAILLLIPSAASALNQLADKNFVNSSISTATATPRGTYNLVSDLDLTTDATREAIAEKLGEVIDVADLNDYAFVQVPVSDDDPTEIERTERYKFNGNVWIYEYTLNTSGFTAAQWDAINSGITTALVAKLNGLPTAEALELALGAITQNIQNISTVIPTEATAQNQLADKVYVLTQILLATPSFKGQFTTLTQLEEVEEPKAGDLGIVRTKDTDGHDVFTFYQYLDNLWNEYYVLSYHPQDKPATTGWLGDYPYNGMGRVELPMNMVEGWPDNTWIYLPKNDVVYLLYSWRLQLYAVYNTDTQEGLGLDDNLVVQPANYDIADIEELVDGHYLPFTEDGGVWTITKPDGSTITSTELNNTNIYHFNDPTHHGINVLTQAMLNRPNTIYVIQHDFTLAEDVTIPANCILEFDGGSISGEHTITGSSFEFSGTLKNVLSGVTVVGYQGFVPITISDISESVNNFRCLYLDDDISVDEDIELNAYQILDLNWHKITTTGTIKAGYCSVIKNGIIVQTSDEDISTILISLSHVRQTEHDDKFNYKPWLYESFNPLEIGNLQLIRRSSTEERVGIAISLEAKDYIGGMWAMNIHNLYIYGRYVYGISMTAEGQSWITDVDIKDIKLPNVGKTLYINKTNSFIDGIRITNISQQFNPDSTNMFEIMGVNNCTIEQIIAYDYASYNNVHIALLNPNKIRSLFLGFAQPLTSSKNIYEFSEFYTGANIFDLSIQTIDVKAGDNTILSQVNIASFEDVSADTLLKNKFFASLPNNAKLRLNSSSFSLLEKMIPNIGVEANGTNIRYITITKQPISNAFIVILEILFNYSENAFFPYNRARFEAYSEYNGLNSYVNFTKQDVLFNDASETVNLSKLPERSIIGLTKDSIRELGFKYNQKAHRYDGTRVDAKKVGYDNVRPVGIHTESDVQVGQLYPDSDIGFCFYDRGIYRPIFAMEIDSTTGAVKWRDANGQSPRAHYGSTRPTFLDSSKDLGFMFYDTTLARPIFWTSAGGHWITADGIQADVQRSGTWANRPTVPLYIHEGFQYMLNEDGNHFPIYAHILTNYSGIEWYKADGTLYER